MRFISLALLLTFVAARMSGAPTSPDAVGPASPESRLAALLARPDLAAYRGWLKFLRTSAEMAAVRDGVDAEAAKAAAQRLGTWLERIENDPALLSSLRGVQEWAYESPADDSGQPFKIMIPTDYDPEHPPGLNVYMHGYTGDHLKHSTGMTARTGDFEIAVLGRARGGWYTGLSQADVLHVIDYVQAHWRVDPARVVIGGGSMGGGATFKLGSRYPHRFAAGQITCGYMLQEPIANLLTFPIYAIHSEDDMTVPVLHARGPLRELRRLGGDAIYDLTNGYGHASWNYAEGNARSAAWAAHQRRPDSRAVRRIDFTALDGGARRAWWGEVAAWGAEARPAHFQLHAGANNTLFAELTNIARLRVSVDGSPFDLQQPLRVVIGGAVAIERPAPLPASLVLAATESGWVLEDEAPPSPYRLHTPGGAIQLYDGSPLLIVYGTRGDEPARAAMRAAAEAASHSPNPAWVGDAGETDPSDLDHTPHHRNLFGALRTKADVDVTDADIARCHLVLIGSAAENRIVERIAAQLPVRRDGDLIACSDGFTLPAAGRMTGLLHYNPLAPARLIFWFASHSPAGYAPNATLPLLAAGILTGTVSDTCFFTAADFIVTGETDRMLVAARSLDTQWRWIPGRERSPLLPAACADRAAFDTAVAECARRATGSDFAAAGPIPALGERPICAETTRVSDVVPFFYAHPIDVVEISGEDLLAAAAHYAAARETNHALVRLQPEVSPDTIDAARRYRIALPMLQVGPYAKTTQSAPRRQWRSGVMMDEALERFLAAP